MALIERITIYETTEQTISYRQQQNALPSVKNVFPRYKTVYSKVLQMTLKKLDYAFKSFLALNKKENQFSKYPTLNRLPKFRRKEKFFTLSFNQSGFKLKGNSIHFSHKISASEGGFPLDFSLPTIFQYESFTVKQVEIKFDSLKGMWFVCITKTDPNPTFWDNGFVQTWDLGLNWHVSVNTNGMFFRTSVKRFDKYWIPNIQKLQTKRDRCKENSRRWYRYNRAINRCTVK
jgi:putative transposase